MRSERIFSRTFIPWGRSSEYTLSGDLAEGQILELARACLDHVIPQQLYTGKTVDDLKGRDPQLLIDGSIAGELKPSGDELLFLAGTLPVAIEESEDDEEEKRDKENGDWLESFQIRLNSHFSRFIGNHHIENSLTLARQGDLPEDLAPAGVLELPGLELEHFRLGLEVFRSWGVWASWALSPVADQRLLLEADRRRLNLKIVSETQKTGNELPLAEREIFKGMCAVMKEIFRFDLEADYLRLAR